MISAHGRPIGNGERLPLAELPLLDYDLFADSLLAEYGRGSRVAAHFALPGDAASAGRLELISVLARERNGNFAVFRTSVDGRFPSLTPNCPQLHLFEREIAEQFEVQPDGHPWRKPVRQGTATMAYYAVEGDGIHEVAVGPVHAGIIEPGHFRFQCDGETVLHLEIALGYQHRGLEQLLTGGPHPATGRQIEVIAGDTSVGHMTAHSLVLEGLAGCEIAPRAQAIRALGLELERLANHVGDIGALSGDIGFLPTASFCGRLRGDFLNLTAALCGSRFGRGLVRPGGVGFDLDPVLVEQMLTRLAAAATDTLGACRLFFDTPSVLGRLEGVGRLSRSTAEDLGLVGVAARACGVPRDSRFFFPVGSGRHSFDEMITDEKGDVFARARMRQREIEVSLELVRRQLGTLPAGETVLPLPPLAPDSLCLAMVEGWRGEVVHVALTGRDGRFRRYKVVDPSFHNWSGLAVAMRGTQVSDFPLCNKSFNLSYCGFDL